MDKKIYKAQVKNVAQSPQKLRLVADLVRGKNVEKADKILRFLDKKGAGVVLKCLNSAVANAENIDSLKPEKLKILSIMVDEAPVLKRVRFASRARVSTIIKRRSNLTIELTDK
jgi:large subunit ribosomal protein L22